jgi:hypothetical protein
MTDTRISEMGAPLHPSAYGGKLVRLHSFRLVYVGWNIRFPRINTRFDIFENFKFF